MKSYLQHVVVKHALLIAAVLGTIEPIDAQDTGEIPVFEAASIRESAQRPLGAGSSAPDRFTQRYTTLSSLLVYAYDVTAVQIEGEPGWANEKRFDVEAKAERAVSRDQMRRMVQRLLADRFRLRSHFETREMMRYALVMARDDRRPGERLRLSSIDCPSIVANRGPEDQSPAGPPQPGDPPRCALMARAGGGTVTMIVEGVPLRQFARYLQPRVDRIVVDRTGLAGTYDMELTTGLPSLPGLDALGQPATPFAGLSLSTALQEQLGLKLESERGPVDVLVVDRVEMPSPN